MMLPEPELRYVRVGRVEDIAPGNARGYTVGRYEVAVFNIDGTLHALENSCPHQGGPLAEGWLEGPMVTCPWHGWCFDVRSGKMSLGDFAIVPRFGVQIRGADVYVSTEPIE